MNEGLPDGIEQGDYKKEQYSRRDAQRGCMVMIIYTLIVLTIGLVMGWLMSM